MNVGRAGERIPRVIHRIWFGELAIPATYEKYWDAWQRQYPDFEFRTWRDSDIQNFSTRDAIARAEGMARKADIARLEILLVHGGIYLDCDIFPLHRFDDNLLHHELVVCNEDHSNRYCTNAFIAAAPGSAVLSWAVDTIMHRELNRRPPNEETGPWFFGEALAHGTYTRLKSHSFYPYLHNEPFSAIFKRDLSGTYGVHAWAGSWQSDEHKRNQIGERLDHGDMEEAAHLVKKCGLQLDAVLAFCDSVKAARETALHAAKHQLLKHKIKIHDKAPLDFVKSSLFLLSRVPDALVWQIGAADGILVDPLRASLVNFDPPAVLVEPNPYLFEMLKRNYQNNKNAKLVNAALAEGVDKLALNAINPDKVVARNLPAWAIGISSAYMDRNPIGGLSIDAETARLIGECIEPIDADAVNVDFLLSLHDNAHPSIVVIDVEGMDTQIVELIINKGIKPFILQFECQWLQAQEFQTISELLKDDYVTIQFGNDIVAYRSDFMNTYCEHLFVENGIHTIHHDALKFVLNLN